jgi:hypothetical protein
MKYIRYTKMADKSTTIKLSKATKQRLDNLQVYPKEPYDRILARILEILNTCRFNPLKSRAMLIGIEKQRKMNGLNQSQPKAQPKGDRIPDES